MSQKYFTTLTSIGAALHANAQLQQTTVPWTHLVLGDGNGVEPVPSPAQTGVIREVDRLAISSIEPDPDNPNWIVIEAVIPADRGGYVVREAALMGGANSNQCIAVGNYPSATKPLLSEGAGSELVIRVVVEIAHTATVTLKIDPAVVIASRDWVEKQHATQQKRGLVRLATIPETLLGEAADIAVTPQSVMRLVSELSADSGMVVISTVGVTNWDVPEVLRSGKKKALVKVKGGGGGGGCSPSSAGGGGGEGGLVAAKLNLSGLQTVTCTVGTGGAGGTPTTFSGSVGGTSSFGEFLSGSGGGAGQGVSASTSGASGGGGASGTGLAGALVYAGSGGGAAYASGAVANSGAGGGGGAGQTYNIASGATGSNALKFGGGGGGSIGNAIAGRGMSGFISIEW